MNKKYILIFSFLFVLFVSIPFVKSEILDFFNFSKKILFYNINMIDEKIYLFINQAEKIKNLQNENAKLKRKIAKFNSFFENCKDLKKFEFVKNSYLIFAKTISFAALPDFSQIYVNFTSEKYPKGLVYNNLAAGILIKRVGNYSLGVLNSNKKAIYTVYIGKNEIPGIFFGKIDIIKYIPKFKKINVGDLVITSGLDGIFYKGAKVGIITNIKMKKLYQEAKVKLFYNRLNPDYFYVVDKNISIENKGGKNGFAKY